MTPPGKFWLVSAWFFIFGFNASSAAPDEDYKALRPLFEKHCYKCHSPEKKKGDLDLSAFTEYQQVLQAKDTWQLVLERVQAYEMPPKGQPGLDYGTFEKLVTWLRALPKPERPDCERIASDRNTSFYHGYVMSRRLNRAEYNNTVRDLFGVDLHLEELLPADGGGGEGFDTTGSALFVSSIHIEKYLAAADQALSTVLQIKPNTLANNTSASPLAPSAAELRQARARVLVSTPSLFTSPRTAARKVISSFLPRAFRRPVTTEEIDRVFALFDRAFQRGDGFVPSIKSSLAAALVSPKFLFLVEPEPPGGGIQRLEPLPLAAKLSYFIWSSMPDDELLNIAASGALFDTNVYRQQLHRLLADPKAGALGDRFAVQWLNLDRLGTEVRPDPKKFPEFDAELSESMRAEAVTFFNHIIHEDRSLLELIDSDYTFVNGRLAQLYAIDGISGPGFQPVKLTDSNRGGVLGMAAIHALTSYPLRTSPVLRGRWLMEALLGEKVNPPPPDVPALEQDPQKTIHVTLRAQLEAHRIKADCAVCHDKMDPLGFGLENFDVLGRWRDEDRGQPIDAQGKLSSGVTYVGPAGLRKVLMSRKDDVIRNLVKKMMGFAYGRELNRFDDCVVDKTMKALQQNNYRASVLVEQIAFSYPFQHRFYPRESLAYEPAP